MNEKLIEKMAAAMSAKNGASHSQMFWRDRAREALAVVHKHLSPSAVEDCIEDNVLPTIDETIMGVKEAARDIRKLIAPPRKKK